MGEGGLWTGGRPYGRWPEFPDPCPSAFRRRGRVGDDGEAKCGSAAFLAGRWRIDRALDGKRSRATCRAYVRGEVTGRTGLPEPAARQSLLIH